jgi:ABC-2 type transport system permease protein
VTQAFWALTRRELGSYFLSLSGYVIIAATLFLMGTSLVVMIQQLQQDPTALPATELFFNTAYFWYILLLTTPIITMRLFALEKFSGTFETLMTAPVRDLEVVMAKFTAAQVFFVLMWLPTLACLLVVRHYSSDSSAFDPGALASTFLAILLLGAMFVSMGCLASALTRNQVVAAMISLAMALSLFLLGYLADRFPNPADWKAQVLSCFGFFNQMNDFTRGVVDSRPVVLYLSLTLLFLFLTLRVIESRRWK